MKSFEPILDRLLRAPALHFLLAGGLLFALASRPSDARRAADMRGNDASAPITITTAALDRLRGDWSERTGAPPNKAEEESLVQLAVDEEILVRAALALGFDRGNRAVEGRLVQLGGFLALAPEEDRDGLEREARSLDLVRSDPVIRRHLVEMMRVAVEKPLPSDMPSESELVRYYERTAERWALPVRVRLTHVYLGAERHGGALEEDAAHLLDDLRRKGITPEEVSSLGDPFARGTRLGPAGRAYLDRTFGAGFFDATAALETGTWAGPVRSAYGLHLVWIHERQEPRRRPLETVRSQVLLAYLHDRGEERLRETLQTLRARYPVEMG